MTLEDEDSFAVVWLKLMYYVLFTSAARFDKIKDQMRSKRPSEYAGQDISKLGKDYYKLAEELTKAGFYDHNLTKAMVEGFLKVM